MLMGLSLGAAGEGIDPVTGGTITCNAGDTFDPATSMCYDPSSDAPEYYGTLTLPANPVSTSTALQPTATVAASTVSTATCPAGDTCSIISGIPDTYTYLALAAAAFWFFTKGGHV